MPIGANRVSRNGNLGAAIPDSAIAQYDYAQETGYSDGGTVSPLADFIETNDLGTGSSTFKTNIQNGNPVGRYDGVGDGHYDTAFSVTQPLTIIAVVVDAKQPTDDDETIVGRADSNDAAFFLRWWQTPDAWNITAGSELSGSNTSAPVILTAKVDGANSLLRENGTQTASGDAGTKNLQSTNVGAANGNAFALLHGDLGEVMIYDEALSSSDVDSEESRLSGKWGISLA